MDKIVIIDGNSLINRAFYALPPLRASDGKIYNAVFGCCNIITKLIQEIKPEYMVVAFDHARKTFRNEIYADYKGTRKGMPEELAQQMPVLKSTLNAMGIKCIEKDGIEADDIIGTLARRFSDKIRCIILTGDRDCLQLIDEEVEVWLTKQGISNIVSENLRQLKEDFGLTPSQVIDLKGLMGDASDNIPGVPGVGEKTAMKLLEQFGTLENIYKNIDKIPGKLGQKLAENKDLAEISYILATIKTDCDIDCKLEDCKYTFPFSEDVRKLYIKYEFRSLSQRDYLFNSQEKDENNAKNIEISIKNLKNTIKSNGELEFLAFYTNGTEMHIAVDKVNNYVLTNVAENEVLTELKEFFENEKIKKIFYSKKVMLHKLCKLGLKLNNAFDVSLGVYLINSNVREDDPRFMFDFLNLPTQTYATSLLEGWDYVLEELPKKGLDKLYFDMELPLVDVLFDMEETGVKVDIAVLDELAPRYKKELDALTNQIYDFAGQVFNIYSPKQLGKVLFEDMKLSDKRNKKHSTAVDKLMEIAYLHPIIPAILRHRTVSKLLSTYLEGIRQYVGNDGKIHTIFNQTLTVTGRLSSVEPNLQNIPIRTDEGRELRKMFVPSSEENVLLCADYSQIELRLMAHYSEDYNLCMAYRNGVDIHALTASKLFGVPASEVTDLQRRTAKAVNFGIIYGISPYGLANNLGNITAEQAREYIDAYFTTYPTIQKFMEKSVEDAKNQGFVTSLFGRIRNIDLSTNSKKENAFGARAAMNMPLQGTASDIIKLAMIDIHKALKDKNLKTKMILQIHDELIFDVPKNELETVYEIVKNKMENVVELHIPLIVAINYGKNWFECDK